MKKESSDSFDAHIADLQKEVTGLETILIPLVTKKKEESHDKAQAINFKTDPVRHSLHVLQENILDANLATLHITSVLLKEFCQMWEQHKLLSEYVDDKAGETSDEIRTEFHRKQKEMMDRYEPLFQGIMGHLDKLKENKAKYQGGPGDV